MARIALVAIGLALGAAIGVRQALNASRPQLVGSAVLPGAAAPVSVVRDAEGVPTIEAGDRLDLARALGFVHAQERFFQMDLLRRAAAGEVAALVGETALDFDRARRLHRMRAVAERTLALAHAEDLALVQAYADGVNAGLAALRARPIEYLVLRAEPRPWSPIDTVLATHAIWFDLTDADGERERELARLAAALPPAALALLMPRATPWDAPLRPAEPQPAIAPLPDAAALDLRREAPRVSARRASHAPDDAQLPGSNNFAVDGSLTADHRAILAGDMHLQLAVPNIWFRARLRAPGLDVTGVTLPGVPVVAAGSNGRVAWAFTNSYGDWTDLRRLEVEGDRYRTADGWQAFVHQRETIEVAHGAPQSLDVRETRFGPVIEDQGGRYAIEWLAHRPDATNLELLHAEQAGGLDELIALAPRFGIPPLNMVAVDATGRIGWTIAGRIPVRDGWQEASDGWLPRPGSAPVHDAGYLDGAGIAVVDPPGHRLWTANGRVASGAALVAIGDSGYDLGARASQIRDALAARERFAEADLLAIQLDDRALFLAPWRALLLATLTPERTAASELRAAARRLVEGWSGRAAIDDAGYRIVRGFRLEVRRQLVEALEAPLREVDPEFLAFDGRIEGPLWRMVVERPAHLRPPGATDWDGFLLAALDASLPSSDPRALARATWGEANRARIRHPLAVVPGFGALFDMPATPLPGDSHMPRVQARRFGASQRMVVSPGHERDGSFEMPAGQSGHPLAPYYGAGHGAWEQGRPTPFLPGPPRWRLELVPSGSGGRT
jgi:penicillin amidase